jgi:hypothetical protein
MAVTPNFGWPVPVATDFVKDGWDAISDLGNAIDTTVAGLGSGLTLVKSQTIGSAVSTVTVSNAFSSTYDNYKIILNGGTASTGANLSLKLGSTATGYYRVGFVAAPADAGITASNDNNAASWTVIGRVNTTGQNTSFDLIAPNKAELTYINGFRSGVATNDIAGGFSGTLNNTTQYTEFTLTASTGTMTGGTIRVYGYKI